MNTQDPTTQEPTTQDPPPPSDGGSNPNHEAAKYRRERNEARTERDALRARLDERDRADVQRLAADRLADPDDLWLATSLDAMRADDGSIDMDKAQAEVERVATERPHWRKVALPASLHQGAREPVAEPPKPPSFGETIRRTRHG